MGEQGVSQPSLVAARGIAKREPLCPLRLGAFAVNQDDVDMPALRETAWRHSERGLGRPSSMPS